MKRLFLYLLLFLSLGGYGQTISYNDENVIIKDSLLLYKNKPYSGKVQVDIKDEIEELHGFMNYKNGILEGLTELLGNNGEQIKFTLINGKYEGDFIINVKESVMKMKASESVLNKMYMKSEGSPDFFDLTFEKGQANGSMSFSDLLVVLKNGIAKVEVPGGEMEVRVHIDQQNGNLTIEGFYGESSVFKEVIPNPLLDIKIERLLYEDIFKQKGDL